MGTQRIYNGNNKDHVLKVYPNPVITGEINISIDAKFDDLASIRIVDVYGNTLNSFSPKEIKVGQNIFSLNRTYRLSSNSHYFIVVQFKNYSDAVKIFFIR